MSDVADAVLDVAAVDERVLADPAREAARVAHAAAVDALLAPVEDAFAAAFAEVYAAALAAVGVTGLVAAGYDVNAAGRIRSGWAEKAPGLGKVVGDVFDAGALSLYLAHEGAFDAATRDPDLDPWSVTNRAGAEHVAAATNRVVGLGDTAWEDARRVLRQAIDDGWDTERTTAALQDRLAVGQARARTIARTEVVGAMNAGTIAAGRSLGPYAPRVKVWLAAMDSRTRDSHYLADGQRRIASKAFDVGGARLHYPGDPAGPPGETVNCRCTLTWEESGNEPAPGDEVAPPRPRPRRDDPPPPPTPEGSTPQVDPPTPDPDPDPTPLDPAAAFRADVLAARQTYDAAIVDLDVRGAWRDGAWRVRDDDYAGAVGVERAASRVGELVDVEVHRRLEASGKIAARLPDEERHAYIRELQARRAQAKADEEAMYDLVTRDVRADPRFGQPRVREVNPAEVYAGQEVDVAGHELYRVVERREDLPDDDAYRFHLEGGTSVVVGRRSTVYVRRAASSAEIDVEVLTRLARDPEYARLRRVQEEGLEAILALGRGGALDQADYARTLREVLADVRGMGGTITSNAKGATARMVAEVGDLYPSEWIADGNAIPGRLNVVRSSGRAHYQRGARTYYDPDTRSYESEHDLLIPSVAKADTRGREAYRTANYAMETAVHEFGHRMEHARPQVRLLEWLFHKRRTVGEDATHLGAGYGPQEFAKRDKFADAYAGKEYGGTSSSYWELFTMGAQVYLSPVVSEGMTARGYVGRMMADDDYRRWFAGVLALA